jgi:hypothetical protein
LGAKAETRNFIVEAPSQALAERVGEWAEYYRKEKAMQWLGNTMPDWGAKCPLRVVVTYGGSGGATSFAFDRGRILSIDMQIEGRIDRLIASVLPHEVTHTVFAQHFRCPVPRWADEGGSVLSEDDQERLRHDKLVREIIRTPGRMIPLERLFALTQYPRDVMVLYAEGYSVTSFLVGKSSRKAFLAFIGDGMQRGWDMAVQTHYGYKGVRDLEAAWLRHLSENPASENASTTAVASANNPRRESSAVTATSSLSERKTLPPVMPILGAPRAVARGTAPEEKTIPTADHESTRAAQYPAPPGWPEPGTTTPISKTSPKTPTVKLEAPRRVTKKCLWFSDDSPSAWDESSHREPRR